MHQLGIEAQSIEAELQKFREVVNLESSLVAMTEFFKELRKNCISETFRQEISENPTIFYHTLKIVSQVTRIPFVDFISNEGDSNVSQQPTSGKEVAKTAETLSLVKNLCNESKQIPDNLDTKIGNNVIIKERETHLLSLSLSDEVVSFSVLVMQFLSNAIVQSPQAQLSLWHYSKNFLGNLVRHPELRLQEVIGAIVYYIFKGCPSCREEIVQNDALMTTGINLLQVANTEFWYIFFEFLAAEGTKFGIFFFKLTSDDKLIAIELVETILNTNPSECAEGQNTENHVSADVISCFIQEFNKNCDLILVTSSKGPRDINPTEVVSLLRVLCKVSADPCYMPLIQNNKSLIINCVYLLRALHDASSDPTSNVASVKKVEDTIRERSRLEASSAYGLKADIIRIIGNLMYNSRENQNFVRENKVIEIILESTCYDGLNPFIKEWSILAIKNFCDSNESNQRYIGNLKRVDQLSRDVENILNSNAGNDTCNLQNAVDFFKGMDS